ncbi:DUF3515 domain-containing protein [Pseudonocardia sp.]|uniref:DUF3515 domain-containing protein n=1 Tax=Pseudonocardia sp. TaxID=60912 RepID=UPI003D140F2B
MPSELGTAGRVAIALPLLLAVAVAALGIAGRLGGGDAPGRGEPDTRPLAVAPVEAPDAGGPECAAVLAALPADLPSDSGALPPRALAEPAPAGVRAWAAAPRPVVLRCGLTRPAELNPTSSLLEIDGVSWLQLPADVPDVSPSYVAVDRPVYLALTVATDLGSGPLQVVSEALRILPETPVAVR